MFRHYSFHMFYKLLIIILVIIYIFPTIVSPKKTTFNIKGFFILSFVNFSVYHFLNIFLGLTIINIIFIEIFLQP